MSRADLTWSVLTVLGYRNTTVCTYSSCARRSLWRTNKTVKKLCENLFLTSITQFGNPTAGSILPWYTDGSFSSRVFNQVNTQL